MLEATKKFTSASATRNTAASENLEWRRSDASIQRSPLFFRGIPVSAEIAGSEQTGRYVGAKGKSGGFREQAGTTGI
jgi:hypothetical protein